MSSFAEMMTARTGDRDLEPWLTAVEADDGQLKDLVLELRRACFLPQLCQPFLLGGREPRPAVIVGQPGSSSCGGRIR
jgi:hypothetical protein